MNVQIERADAKGNWHDEGRVALCIFKARHSIDPFTATWIDIELTAGRAYEVDGYRLTRIEENSFRGRDDA